MGTEITLKISGVTFDWSKNDIGIHHGPLFQEKDRKRLHCEQVNYAYYEEHGEDPAAMEMSFCRPLRAVLPRLEILGVRLSAIQLAYDTAAKEWADLKRIVADGTGSKDSSSHQLDPMTFDEFLEYIRANPMPELDTTPNWGVHPDDKQRIRGRFDRNAAVERIPFGWEHDQMAYSEQSYFVATTSFLGPYATLRMLAECHANLELDVVWQYGPLVDSGWAPSDAFTAGPSRRQKTLIATEGSSDVHILTHALKLLRPEIADFFRFIDVSDRHPFSGTGSLANFAEGLSKIDVHNQVLFVFDNDAEGVEAAARVRRLKLPPNMSVLVLPDLVDFQQFPTQGPNGVTSSDINGRAGAIECYLDLRLPNRPPARVRWTSFKRDPDLYQGVLEHKGTYMDAFLEQSSQSLRDGGYDTSKIECVLDALIEECSRLAMVAAEV
ncbi:MAG: HEPN/Toprim-associated domain-containing protein [Rhodoferax sp.]